MIIARTQTVTPSIVGFGLVNPARTYEAIAQVGGTVDYVNPALQKGAILPAGRGADAPVAGRFQPGNRAG